MLFHTFVELFSIVVAFAVFIVAWNSRHMQDNKYLHLVGISYIFIGALDLLHTLSFKGMNILPVDGFPANQFWVATRMMEAMTLLLGFLMLNRKKRLNTDLIFLGYFVISTLIILSILVWQNFPVCFIDGAGQTSFKIWMEYLIICILVLSAYLMIKRRSQFSPKVYPLILASIIFAIISECCFATYTSNFGPVNELGHYGKLIAFFLIYKANVETGFVRPADYIFRNLTEREEQYRTLAENLPGIVLRYDAKLNCIYSNQTFSGRMHTDPIVGHFLNADDLERFQGQLLPKIQLALASGLVQQASFQQHIAGKEYYFAIQIIPEDVREGANDSILVIGQDVTTLRQTERQLQHINQTKDKLFSIIAHDLRNPFTTLLSYSELISAKSESMDRPRIGQMARRINDTAKQTYTLLENLLQWSRVQTGLLQPNTEPILLLETVEDSLKVSKPIAVAKNITLEVDIKNSLIVLADKQMLATILRNLISNALKFSFEGETVFIAAEAEERRVVISIRDTGTGIPEENKQALLELTNTLSLPGTAAEPGTGLGLVLCKEFVQLNGGEIWLESELGKGTTFFFTLLEA